MTNQFQKVAIIGGGYMGTQIAIQCALFGLETSVYVRSDKSKKKFGNYLCQFQEMLKKSGRYRQEKILKIEQRIIISNALEEVVNGADVIIEAVIEDIEAKKAIFNQISSLVGNETLIASNTSTFVPSMFIDCMKRPENFACIHFHTYVWTSSVVEIMPHANTSSNTLQRLKKFASKTGQVPLLMKKESANYVFNAMMMEVNRVALSMVSNGIADVREIDMAWRGILKISNGPFAIMDMVGLDTIYEVNNYWAKKLDNIELKKNSELLKEYVDAGKLGYKSGEGFYKYR